MDQYTRRIIGFGVHAGTVNGVALCRMFNRAIRWQPWMPKYLSSDHDPLYRFGQWVSQSADPGGDRNQDRSLCSPVPSLCGTADRHDSTRVFGSHVVLDHGGPGEQAARFPRLLQPPSDAFSTCRMYAAGDVRPEGPSELRLLPMATTLWRFISNAHCRLTPDHQTLKTRTNCR